MWMWRSVGATIVAATILLGVACARQSEPPPIRDKIDRDARLIVT